jgi:hypothetical protein
VLPVLSVEVLQEDEKDATTNEEEMEERGEEG